jgi:ribose/xylose/arabinose/galactoside ABC-type transport system permease subunit
LEKQKKSRLKLGGNFNVLFIWLGFISVITLFQVFVMSPGAYPTMVSPSNLMNIFMQVSATGIMAMGMSMIMISGGIDLSVGMMTSFVVLFTAKSFIYWHYPLFVAIIVSIIFAVLMESLMGFIISRLKVEPFIITLGGMICIRGASRF